MGEEASLTNHLLLKTVSCCLHSDDKLQVSLLGFFCYLNIMSKNSSNFLIWENRFFLFCVFRCFDCLQILCSQLDLIRFLEITAIRYSVNS